MDEVWGRLKDLNILYVEDSDDVREIFVYLLSGGEPADNIIIAKNGKEGLEKFKQNKIDLVITDINMPEMNGLEMAEKIREEDKEIPIITISAHDDRNFFIKSIEIGIDGYLIKPVDYEQLQKVLSRVIKKYSYYSEFQKNLHLLKTYQKVANLSSIVSKTDTKGVITHVSDTFCEISGYTREELLGKPHNIVRHPDNPKKIFEDMWETLKRGEIWRGIVRNRKKDGKSYYADSMIMPITDLDGNIIEYISLRHDVTEIMNPLKQLKEELNNCKNPMLVYMRLDKFELLEEFYDEDMLLEIQKAAKGYIKREFEKFFNFDRLYTIDNGECALVMDMDKITSDENETVKELKKLQIKINNGVIKIKDINFDIKILMSVAFNDRQALKSAKLGIKKLLTSEERFILSGGLAHKKENEAKKNMEMFFVIKKALETDNIVSFFQPIVDNATGKIIKFESLVRLVRDGEAVSPFFFLEIAKRTGTYYEITRRVMENALKAVNDFEITLNLSAIDIENRGIREFIFGLLEQNRHFGEKITFELLEDENIKNEKEISDFINYVKNYGVKIAIDDFGSGYSSYERLLIYQPDILKIDGSLIKNIQSSGYSLSIVKSIVTFAKEQNLKTVGEFVENEEIYNILKNLGVDYSQGYYFGKPDRIDAYRAKI
jgi:PAS domain S-box-containing protein